MKRIFTALFCALCITNAYGTPCPDTYPIYDPNTTNCYLITKPGEYVPYNGAGAMPCPAGDYCPGGNTIYNNIQIPKRYQPIEYLENNSTAYIDTGYIPTSATTVNADVMITGGYIPTTYYLWIPFLGTRSNSDTNNTKRYAFFLQLYNGIPNFDYFDATLATYTAGGNFMNKRFTIKTQISDSQIHTLVDNVIAYSTPVAPAPDFQYGIYLFAMANDAALRHAYGRFYYYQTYESDVLVQNMIPVFDTESEQYGMYDTVGDKFFPSANDGKFTGGPALPHSGGNYSCTTVTDNEFTASPPKSTDIADCGRVLHIGPYKIYMRRRKITPHALAIQLGNTTLYAEMTSDKCGHLRTSLNGVIYSICNIDSD